MNSRRLMRPLKPRIIPYHIIGKALLCITAFWPTRLPQWVITGIPLPPPIVRFLQLRT
jgi:hypothetical protein